MKRIFATIFSFLAIPFHSALAQWNVADIPNAGLPGQNTTTKIILILLAFTGWLFIMFAVLGIIAFLIAGILYLTSAGDEDQAKRAKRAMTYAIIGGIVGMSGLVAIRFVYGFLSGTPFILY